MKTNREKLSEVLEKRGYKNEDLINEIEKIYSKQQLPTHVVSSSLPNVYEEPHNSARIKFYKHLAETMNISEYATRHIFNEACDWYKTLT